MKLILPLHAVLCAAGYNIRWLMRVIVAKGIKALDWLSLRPIFYALCRGIDFLLLPLMPARLIAPLAHGI
ncbi:MAG: hypothetical protein QM533_06120 [Cytophagales bacterium]|nr:hypothetical protein [Cytophagales bacterium]